MDVARFAPAVHDPVLGLALVAAFAAYAGWSVRGRLAAARDRAVEARARARRLEDALVRLEALADEDPRLPTAGQACAIAAVCALSGRPLPGEPVLGDRSAAEAWLRAEAAARSRRPPPGRRGG